MKLIIFACLAAVALARPQRPDSEAETVLDERSDNGDGNFQYTFETSNGISSSNQGTPGSEGQSNMQGSFSFPLADGTIAQVSFIADENGYQPSSDLLPVAPPLPEHVYELLRIAEDQRARGITFE
ncbi:cuticle protein AMP4-like [Penaeus japonicus]|uniref:cuticle protein AMP4-like n=1 Tax=Penaeus japonicus TaxID=27405 RepID=UPI001C7144D3|nr:cuticle protein AMP4-like [Penaeus japonicus]XP_042891006.1 cuticle protein AMP4-like [Penaeus japonicus]